MGDSPTVFIADCDNIQVAVSRRLYNQTASLQLSSGTSHVKVSKLDARVVELIRDIFKGDEINLEPVREAGSAELADLLNVLTEAGLARLVSDAVRALCVRWHSSAFVEDNKDIE